MSIINAIFGRKEKPIQVEQIEILIHTNAAYFGEHGRMLASNKELGIVEKPVIFCIKGFTTPLPLNHRLFAHIWQSFLADGWVPLELIKYGSIIEKQEQVERPQGGQRVMLHLAEGGDPAATTNLIGGREAAPAAASMARDFSNVDVPAYLRKQAEAGEGFTTPGFQDAIAG